MAANSRPILRIQPMLVSRVTIGPAAVIAPVVTVIIILMPFAGMSCCPASASARTAQVGQAQQLRMPQLAHSTPCGRTSSPESKKRRMLCKVSLLCQSQHTNFHTWPKFEFWPRNCSRSSFCLERRGADGRALSLGGVGREHREVEIHSCRHAATSCDMTRCEALKR